MIQLDKNMKPQQPTSEVKSLVVWAIILFVSALAIIAVVVLL